MTLKNLKLKVCKVRGCSSTSNVAHQRHRRRAAWVCSRSDMSVDPQWLQLDLALKLDDAHKSKPHCSPCFGKDRALLEPTRNALNIEDCLQSIY